MPQGRECCCCQSTVDSTFFEAGRLIIATARTLVITPLIEDGRRLRELIFWRVCSPVPHVANPATRWRPTGVMHWYQILDEDQAGLLLHPRTGH